MASIPLPGQVSGTVFDSATGNPIGEARVTLQATVEHTTAAPDGTFTLGAVNGTNLVIAGAKKGYYNATVTVTTPATNVDIFLDSVPAANDPNYDFTIPFQCAVCHGAQFDQWADSRMASTGLNTWVYDLFDGTGTLGGAGGFVYLDDSVHAAADPSGSCASCHQPEGWLNTPFQPLDPLSGPLTDAQQRGVSCEVCHKIADVDETQIDATGFISGAVTVTRPDSSGLVEQVMYGLLGDVDFVISNQMRGSYQPQLAAEACAVCHEYNNDPDHDNDFNEPSSIPAQETYSEWKNSPYGDPNDPLYQNCVDCHMPPFSSVPVEACQAMFPPLLRDPSTVHGHNIEGTSAAYLENAVSLALSGQQLGNDLEIDVEIINDQAGHSVPTGVTLRNMILRITATDSAGNSLNQVSGDTIHDLGGIGDPALGNFAGLPGKLFAKINQNSAGTENVLFTEATSINSDNRIPALSSDVTSVAFDVSGLNEDISVEARLIYRRAPKYIVDAKNWTVGGLGDPLPDAQAPDYGFLMESDSTTINVSAGNPGFQFQIPALVISNEWNATMEIQQASGTTIECGGFSMGVGNDANLLTASLVTEAPALANLNGGAGPVFHEISYFADGFTSAVVSDFLLQETISFASVTPVLVVTYQPGTLDPNQPPGGDLLYFTDSLGTPPVQNLVASSGGQAYAPSFVNASTIIFDNPSFTRGDSNNDGGVDIGDPIFSLGILFDGGGPAACDDACDANDDGNHDIADPVRILSFLFSGAAPMPEPTHPVCGSDPTVDSLECDASICP
ncbi:MAG: carboxypeptidase regulatory-like domain-containing protein [Planctomycetota bacterium]|nr:carboxypeptidase regulatory-like domain-containing protein [Planctomycetota bacterium]